jgi:hypothetical protein
MWHPSNQTWCKIEVQVHVICFVTLGKGQFDWKEMKKMASVMLLGIIK